MEEADAEPPLPEQAMALVPIDSLSSSAPSGLTDELARRQSSAEQQVRAAHPACPCC